MGKTWKQEKSPGTEYWGRPAEGAGKTCRVPGKSSKKINHRSDRRAMNRALQNELENSLTQEQEEDLERDDKEEYWRNASKEKREVLQINWDDFDWDER